LRCNRTDFYLKYYSEKPEEIVKEKTVEIKPIMNSTHLSINPVNSLAQRILNGKRDASERGQSVPYIERRYRLIPNVNFVPFDVTYKKEGKDVMSNSGMDSSKYENKKNDGEAERKLMSGDDHSKSTDSLDNSNKSKRLERIKSEPGKIRTTRSMVAGQDLDITDSQDDSSNGHVLDRKFGKDGKFNYNYFNSCQSRN
jgi:hypothetical protein